MMGEAEGRPRVTVAGREWHFHFGPDAAARLRELTGRGPSDFAAMGAEAFRAWALARGEPFWLLVAIGLDRDLTAAGVLPLDWAAAMCAEKLGDAVGFSEELIRATYAALAGPS